MTIRYTDAIAVECDSCHKSFARPGLSVFDLPFEAVRQGWHFERGATHRHYCPECISAPEAA